MNRNEKYNELFIKQKKSCATCFKHQKELQERLLLDTDPKSGKVVGLLCRNCKEIFEGFQRDPDIVQRAKEYMEKWGMFNE